MLTLPSGCINWMRQSERILHNIQAYRLESHVNGSIDMILKEQVDPEQQVDTEGVPLIHLSGSETGVLEFMHIAEMV